MSAAPLSLQTLGYAVGRIDLRHDCRGCNVRTGSMPFFHERLSYVLFYREEYIAERFC